VLAAGSTPAMPPFKGKELSGIYTIWTCEDIAAINRSLSDAKKAVVIGGGLLGLEAAHKISETGISVSLIESMPRLLPKQLDEEGSEIFAGKVRSLGISVLCGKYVSGFGGNSSGHVTQVQMADGTSLEADIVIVAVGVAPNTAVFRDGLFAGYMLVGEPAKAFNKLQQLINTNADIGTIDRILYETWQY
jgi:nitrite reductase (NADH) large subunit